MTTLKTTDLALILRALEFAAAKHKDQRRKDADAALHQSPHIRSTPPTGWSDERKMEYFEWAKQVINQIRGGVSSKLESVFDEIYAQKESKFD